MIKTVYIPPLSSDDIRRKPYYEELDLSVYDHPKYGYISINEAEEDFVQWILYSPSMLCDLHCNEGCLFYIYKEIEGNLSRRPDCVVVFVDAHPGLNFIQANIFRNNIEEEMVEKIDKILSTGYRGEFAYDPVTGSFALNFPDIGEATKFRIMYEA